MAFSVLEQLEACNKPLDVKQVAAIFDVSEKKIRGMVERKELPCIRLGVSLRFDPMTLSHFVRRQSPAFALARREATKNQGA